MPFPAPSAGGLCRLPLVFMFRPRSACGSRHTREQHTSPVHTQPPRLAHAPPPQVFATPKRHPKSKPFFDHVLSFSVADGRVWLRNYQVRKNL